MTDDSARASLDRAFSYIERGTHLARYATAAYDAGDDIQRELFALEVESLIHDFDGLPDDDRALILWVAFTRAEHRRNIRQE